MTTVLIVDDSAMIRRLARAMLTRAGFDIAEAEDGEAGLSAMMAQPPDAVLLDMNMPGLDGPATLRAMKENERLAAVPVVLLTGEENEAALAGARQLGVREVLQKPFNAETLISTVRGLTAT